MKKKLIISGAILCLLILTGYMVFMRSPSKKYDFRMDKISSGEISMLVTATGTVNPVTSVDVGTQVSGIVAKLYADFNSVVKQGQVIAQIDPTFLQQSVKDAEANLDRAKAQYADNERSRDRTKALFEKGMESQLNYDAAVTSYESSAAALKQAQATLDRAKINLAYATIYAPISGVVIDRKVNIGQTVAASFSSPTLYTIANDLQRMQVLTTVDESDIGRISIGQEATFTVDAYPDERFSGIISQIRLAPVSVQNVVNYTVVISVNNDQLKLMPGMTASVRILVASTKDVLRVSNMALRLQPPADLIDSTKLIAMRDSFGGRGGAPGDSSRRGGFRPGEGDPGAGGPGGGGPGGMGGDRRAMFMKMRDSINAAHGGNMSEDDLRAEMRKAFGGGMRGRGNQAPPPPSMKEVKPDGNTSYGITLRFPEYQKSPSTLAQQTGRARLWVLNAQGKLEPVFVRTGLTDGRFTEIHTSELKAGDQIVLGVSSNSDAGDMARSPLSGQGNQQRGPMGPGGFR
jgi:HlyD family secretion protein